MKTKILFLLVLCAVMSIGTVNAQATELITNGGFEDAGGMLTTTESTNTVLQRANGQVDANSATTNPATTATAIGNNWVKKASNNAEQKAIVLATGANGGTNCINLQIQANATKYLSNITQFANTTIQQKLTTNLDVTKKYKVTFYAKIDATGAATKVANFFLYDGTYKGYFSKQFFLTTSWTQYTAIFDLANWKLLNPTADFSTVGSYAGIGISTSTSGTNGGTGTTAYTGILIDDISLTEYTAPAQIIKYVTVTGSGSFDGSSWENAAVGTSANIQTQINAVDANIAPFTGKGEVRFGAGTYNLSTGVAANGSCLTLKDGVNLIGGYPSTPVITTNEARDLANNQTIFDGGFTTRLLNTDANFAYKNITLLDGLILQRGRNTYGSAAVLSFGFVMQNCIVRNNQGSGSEGSAVRVNRNTPTGSDNAFVDFQTGGAFINCVFSNNSTTLGSSALTHSGTASSTLINCVFANNVTTDVTNIKIRNQNSIGRYGAVFLNTSNSGVRIINNIFYNNEGTRKADSNIGYAYNYLGALYNNYFDFDATTRDSLALTKDNYTVVTDPAAAYYKYFTAQNNKCNADYAASTIFVSPNTVVGSSSNQADIDAINNSDWRLKAGSSCINTGISTATADITFPYNIMLGCNRAYSTITSDLSGNSRIDGTVDRGAYESKVATSGNTITISNGEFLASTLSLVGTSDVIVNNGGTLLIDGTSTSINSLTINGGGKVTNNTGSTLTTGSFIINSDASSAIGTYIDNGSTSITGAATVNKYLTGATGSGRANWYISSPVLGATAAVFNVENAIAPINKLAKYNEAGTTPAYVMVTTNAEILTPGVGYVAYNAGADATFAFTANSVDPTTKLNNGELILAPTRTGTTELKRGFNLVGNPYPSFLNWNAVTKTNVRPTIWYRTYTGSAMQFDTFDGSIGTSLGANGLVSQFIPPMQAFWVKVDADGSGGSLTLDNTMRSHQSQVLTNRLRALSTPSILRLKVSNGINADEAIVVTNSNASDGFDRFDSQKMTNATAAIPEIYTMADQEETVINYLNGITPNKELALGFRTLASNTFSIRATEVSNMDEDLRIVLKDSKLNVEQDLSDGSSYSFTSDATNTTSRFSLLFKSSSMTTGLHNKYADNLNVTVYKNSANQITINRSGDIAAEGMVTVCNALGQKLLNTPTTGSSTLISKSFSAGVYLVMVRAEGKITTKKVIIN